MNTNIQHRIDQYLADKLSQKEIESLWIELVEHPEMFDYLKMSATLKSIHDSSEGSSSANSANIWAIYKPWISAAAVILITISVLFSIQTQTSIELTTIDTLSLSEMDVTTTRGVETDSVLDSLLRTGMQAVLDGKIDDSKDAFLKIVQDYSHLPHAAKAYMNLGIIEYNDRNYELAASYFGSAAKISDRTLIQEKAYWFKANAHINLNQIQQARNATANAYAMDGDYRRDAFTLLKKLDAQLGNKVSETATPIE